VTRPDIRTERIRLGLSLPAFAETVGVSYRVARQAERGGAVREDHAKLIADFFGVEPVLFVEPAKAAA
jgi:transcriptional regulator with XRE-family HTH domain